jgi:hypothetical protein
VDVLDSEVVVRRSRVVFRRLVPCPSSPFVELYVARRGHTLCHRVENAVGLRALHVADEHPRSAPIVELADVAKLLGEREAAEDPQVGDRRLAPMPSIIRRPAIESLGRRDGNKSLYLVFVGRVVFSASWTAFRTARTATS